MITPSPTVGRRIRAALVVWLAMVGLDFVLNAAVFAAMYLEGSPFLLAPADAFRRIPLGYLAFLILACSVVELASRLGLRTIRAGLAFGVFAGLVLGSAWSLSLYSVTTASIAFVLAFALIWLSLLPVAGAVAASALGRSSLRGLTVQVALADLLGVTAVIALQSLGVVPTMTL